ncbi:hypothetical protein MBANPS3_011990 [Mucor bainieri]
MSDRLNRVLENIPRNNVSHTARVEARLAVQHNDFDADGTFVGLSMKGELETFISTHIMRTGTEENKSPMVRVNAHLYTTFLSSYISFVRLMLVKFRDRQDPGALTAVTILCYMLSSIFHSPPDKFKVDDARTTPTTAIKQYVHAYFCRINHIVRFLPGVFRLDESNLPHCRVVFNNEILQRFIPKCLPVVYAPPLRTAFSGPDVDTDIRAQLGAILLDFGDAPQAAIRVNVQFDSSHVILEAAGRGGVLGESRIRQDRKRSVFDVPESIVGKKKKINVD